MLKAENIKDLLDVVQYLRETIDEFEKQKMTRAVFEKRIHALIFRCITTGWGKASDNN